MDWVSGAIMTYSVNVQEGDSRHTGEISHGTSLAALPTPWSWNRHALHPIVQHSPMFKESFPSLTRISRHSYTVSAMYLLHHERFAAAPADDTMRGLTPSLLLVAGSRGSVGRA